MRALSWRDKKVDVQPCNFLNFFGKILWKFERPFQNYFEKLLFITILSENGTREHRLVNIRFPS